MLPVQTRLIRPPVTMIVLRVGLLKPRFSSFAIVRHAPSFYRLIMNDMAELLPAC